MSIEHISQDLENRIAFHKLWRTVWSWTYFSGASAAVISAALASASAGFISDSTGEGKALTAGLALAAMIFTALEKVLKMREKWDLHRNNQQAFEIVRLRLLADSEELQAVVDQIEKVTQSYSMQLGDLNRAPADSETGE